MKKLSTQELVQMLEYIRVRSSSERYRAALKQAEDLILSLTGQSFRPNPAIKPGTNITAAHKEMFEACKTAPNLALFSCFVDGQPSSAIVAVVPTEEGDFHIQPLFVTINEYMVITDHDGKRPEHGESPPAN